MPLTITDAEVSIDASGVSHPLTGPALVVIARPTALPLVQNVGGTYREDQQAQRRAPVTALTGAWTLALPWPSETRYAAGTELWQIRRMSGSLYQGYIPEGVAGPLSLDTLVQTYGVATAYKWQIVQAGTQPAAPITAVPGPAGPSVITVKGDLAVGATAGVPARFPAGADGTVPIYDSSQPLGLRTGLPSVPAATQTTLGGLFGRSIDPRTYGAVYDGNSHPLSGVYATLAAAQLVYPFATDLRQELDWAGTQKAINISLGTVASPAPCPGDPAYTLPLPTRVATASVALPPGSAKINSPLHIISAQGFSLYGEGTATTLKPSNVPGTSALSAVVHIDGMADSTLRDFYVQNGDGTEVIAEAISYQWTGTGTTNRSSTRNRFSRIGVQGCRFQTGWGIGTSSAALQVDQSSWHGCSVYGASDYLVNVAGVWGANTTYTGAGLYAVGWSFGSGTSGNAMILSLYDAESFFVGQAYRVNEAKGVSLTGGGTQDCVLSIWLHTEGYFAARDMRCEGDLQFMQTSGITATAAFPEFSNIDWHGNHCNNDGTGYTRWAEMDWAGDVTFNHIHIVDMAAGVLPYIFGNPDTASNSGNAGLTIHGSFQAPSTKANFFRGNSHVVLACTYHQLGGASVYQSQRQLDQHALLLGDKLIWGGVATTGTTFDANLYRSAVNTLKTDGAFVAGGAVTAGGTIAGAAKLDLSGGTWTLNTIGAQVQVGNGPFDGVSTGFFSGNGGGTILAVNMLAAFAGYAIAVNVGSADKFHVTYQGNAVASSSMNAPIMSSGADGTQTGQIIAYHGSIAGAFTKLTGPEILFNRPGASDITCTGAAGTLAIATQNTAANAALTRLLFGAGDTATVTWSNALLAHSDAVNLQFGTTTGTKIGTSASQKIGHYGATPVVQQTVTGSRGGNVALASLLTALAAEGLIVDSSSA